MSVPVLPFCQGAAQRAAKFLVKADLAAMNFIRALVSECAQGLAASAFAFQGLPPLDFDLDGPQDHGPSLFDGDAEAPVVDSPADSRSAWALLEAQSDEEPIPGLLER